MFIHRQDSPLKKRKTQRAVVTIPIASTAAKTDEVVAHKLHFPDMIRRMFEILCQILQLLHQADVFALRRDHVEFYSGTRAGEEEKDDQWSASSYFPHDFSIFVFFLNVNDPACLEL